MVDVQKIVSLTLAFFPFLIVWLGYSELRHIPRIRLLLVAYFMAVAGTVVSIFKSGDPDESLIALEYMAYALHGALIVAWLALNLKPRRRA